MKTELLNKENQTQVIVASIVIAVTEDLENTKALREHKNALYDKIYNGYQKSNAHCPTCFFKEFMDNRASSVVPLTINKDRMLNHKVMSVISDMEKELILGSSIETIQKIAEIEREMMIVSNAFGLLNELSNTVIEQSIAIYIDAMVHKTLLEFTSNNPVIESYFTTNKYVSDKDIEFVKTLKIAGKYEVAEEDQDVYMSVKLPILEKIYKEFMY